MSDTPRSTAPRSRRLTRVLASLGVAAALFVGVGGFLHTNAGRPILAKLTGGSCPFGHTTLDPAARDALRQRGLSDMAQTDTVAPARPALGFQLGSASKSDISAWARAHGVGCKAESKGAGLACPEVAAALLGEAGTHDGSLYFRFDRTERLVGVLRMVRTANAAEAVALGANERAKLQQSMGKPTRESGELTVASVTRGPLRQARAEHRYRDFSAFSSVTNLGAPGYLVTEEAQLVD